MLWVCVCVMHVCDHRLKSLPMEALTDILDMRLFGELQRLEIFFQDETKRGRTPADLYELVQHAGNILPRL